MLTIDQYIFMTPITNEFRGMIRYKTSVMTTYFTGEVVNLCAEILRMEASLKFDMLFNANHPLEEIKPIVINEYMEQLRNAPYSADLPPREILYNEIQKIVFPAYKGNDLPQKEPQKEPQKKKWYEFWKV